MNDVTSDWVDFWENQTVMNDRSWEKNMELFLSGSESFFPFHNKDVVLDIGSGPGFLAFFLKDRVDSIHCIDTSRRYVDEGRSRFSQNGNVSFDVIGSNYLDFSFLNDKKFSKIVCSSVIQYYKDIDEVEQLIIEVRKHAFSGAEMLIADIQVNMEPIKDLVGLLTTSFKNRYLLQVIKFIFKSFGGEYSKIRKNKGLLTLKKSDLDEITKKLQLNAEWRDDVLTLNNSRKHLLIRF
ncbi:class I SAM-dependent methyltransferase [bacterium]|nr:class I SAM-dependent methyltransferase [bacterium]